MEIFSCEIFSLSADKVGKWENFEPREWLETTTLIATPSRAVCGNFTNTLEAKQ